MSDPKHTGKDNAYYQSYLGKLLQKSRSDEHTQRVDDILKSDLPLEDKVRKIEKLDEQKKESALRSLKKQRLQAGETTGKPTSPSPSSLLTDQLPVDSEGFKETARNRNRLKRRVEDNTFLNYVFKDAGKIKRFGKDTHVLATGVLSLKPIPNPDVRIQFTNHVQKNILPQAVHYCTSVVDVGWKHLTKRDYNLVVLFSHLLDEIQKIDFYNLDYKKRNLIDKITSVERYYYVFHSHNEYPNLLLHALRDTAAKEPEIFADQKDPLEFVGPVLLKDYSLPSLYNFILGLNMIKTRRFLSMDDLIVKDSGSLVYMKDFDCSPKIREDMLAYLRELEHQLVSLTSRWEEIVRLQAFIPSKGPQEVDMHLLEDLYNTYRKDHEGTSFQKDKEKTLDFTLEILGLFLTDFRRILTDEIGIEKIGKTRIFSKQFFDMEFGKLASVQTKIEKLCFTLPSFPRKRFLILKQNRKGAISAEAEALQLIDEVSTILYGMGTKIATLLRTRSGNPEKADDMQPLESVALQGKSFYIPYENHKVQYRGLLHGSSVFTAMTSICSCCFLTALYFQNNDITSILKREQKIKEKISEITSDLKRILSPEGYMMMKEKYNFIDQGDR